MNLRHLVVHGLERMENLHVMLHGQRAILRHLPGDAPHIVREGGLWACRAGARFHAGYGYRPDQALREWIHLNEPAGKPADTQDATPTTPGLMAHLGTFPEPRHVHAT